MHAIRREGARDLFERASVMSQRLHGWHGRLDLMQDSLNPDFQSQHRLAVLACRKQLEVGQGRLLFEIDVDVIPADEDLMGISPCIL